jgi:stage II sporulation protein P
MRCLSLLFAMLFAAGLAAASLAAAAPGIYDDAELVSGYVTIVDATGAILMQTGLAVHPGDGYLASDNRLYEITAVEGTLAKARYLWAEGLPGSEGQAVQAPPGPSAPLIALYYTHDDESYAPSDGATTISGNGGIFKVGAAMAERLSALGYATENDQTRHDPHDANAYARSRRTFLRLLGHKPAALFDIHRDSAPVTAYQTTIDGQDATKILLVVGRQNQNRHTTLDYAKNVKSAADAKYPGLVRGIFLAHGSYNQDLNPQALLIEIGTQGNRREAAEHSATLFADVVSSVLPLAGTSGAAASLPAPPPVAAATRSYGRDILSILGALVIGTAAYLYLSTGSWREARRKLANFRKLEFTNFLGPRKKGGQ